MNLNFNDLMDWSDGARRTLDREREKMMERVELIDGLAQAMQAVDEILTENKSLKTELESLRTQLQMEKDLRTKAEMQLGEMSKLSAGVAKKASQEEREKRRLIKVVNVAGNYNDIHDNSSVTRI